MPAKKKTKKKMPGGGKTVVSKAVHKVAKRKSPKKSVAIKKSNANGSKISSENKFSAKSSLSEASVEFNAAQIANATALFKKKTPKSFTAAVKILKSLNLYVDAPSDEIFGDDPRWYFEGLFGTNAPVQMADDCFDEQDGLCILRIRCRNFEYNLIADRRYKYGYIRDMLAVLNIINIELELSGVSERAYLIGLNASPGLVLLGKRPPSPAKPTEYSIFSLADLKNHYESLPEARLDIPWVETCDD